MTKLGEKQEAYKKAFHSAVNVLGDCWQPSISTSIQSSWYMSRTAHVLGSMQTEFIAMRGSILEYEGAFSNFAASVGVLNSLESVHSFEHAKLLCLLTCVGGVGDNNSVASEVNHLA